MLHIWPQPFPSLRKLQEPADLRGGELSASGRQCELRTDAPEKPRVFTHGNFWFGHDSNLQFRFYPALTSDRRTINVRIRKYFQMTFV